MTAQSICLVNALFPPHERGGAENYVQRAATRLQRRGHDVTILTTEPYDGPQSLRPRCEQYEGLDVWRFYPLNLSHRTDGTGANVLAKAFWHQFDTTNPHAVWAAGRALEAIDPDVVHTNNLVGISPAIGQAIRQRQLGHVHTLHDYSLICPKSNLLRDLTAPDDQRVVCEEPPVPCRVQAAQKRQLLGEPDVVTGPSQHVIDVHRAHGFFEGVPGDCLQLGVESVAEHSSGAPESPSMLYVGKQLEAKGLATLFDAATRCDVPIDVCGTGPYSEETATAAEEIPTLDYHGYVSDDRLATARQQATAAVVPSIWMENSPLTIYESFAAGLPVIGSDIGGIPELVADSRGRLVPPGDPEALAAAMTELAADSPTVDSMSANALTWSRAHTLDTHLDELEGVYDRLAP